MTNLHFLGKEQGDFCSSFHSTNIVFPHTTRYYIRLAMFANTPSVPGQCNNTVHHRLSFPRIRQRFLLLKHQKAVQTFWLNAMSSLKLSQHEHIRRMHQDNCLGVSPPQVGNLTSSDQIRQSWQHSLSLTSTLFLTYVQCSVRFQTCYWLQWDCCGNTSIIIMW